jgi:hypothetical protein
MELRQEYLLKLPNDIINNILSYDKHFIIRNGIPVSIITKDDYRYDLLKQRPNILQKTTTTEAYNKYYGETVIKTINGIETRIAVYEYPLLNKCIWSLYNYYPAMMITCNKANAYF